MAAPRPGSCGRSGLRRHAKRFCLMASISTARSAARWEPRRRRLTPRRSGVGGRVRARGVVGGGGPEATLAHYVKTARGSGSTLDEALLASLFAELHQIPLHVQVLDGCGFLHFGSTSQLISSGLELVAQDQGAPPATTILAIDDDVQAEGGRRSV